MQAEGVGGWLVQALALPEFTTTPRSRSHDDEPRVRRTGAAAAALVVNSTADEHGVAEQSTPRSRLPSRLRPACRPAARKPRGWVTEPPACSTPSGKVTKRLRGSRSVGPHPSSGSLKAEAEPSPADAPGLQRTFMRAPSAWEGPP